MILKVKALVLKGQQMKHGQVGMKEETTNHSILFAHGSKAVNQTE